MSTQNEQPKHTGEETARRDDALFEALGKSKKKKRARIIRTVLILILVAVVALVITVSILQRRVREKFNTDAQNILSHVVAEGSINTLVSGSGILVNEDTETVTVPSGVELTEILIENGDTVQEGQLLAIADMATVRNAMSTLQSEIEDLDDQIADADGDKADTNIYAGVPGRIKAVYAHTEDAVSDVMIEHGALAVISLDGYMSLELKTRKLEEGDTVAVFREDGTEISGLVESVVNGIATVLVTDDGPRSGETVTVRTEDGTEIGSGALSIHKPLMVTGYAGNVRSVYAAENARVYKNTCLFVLKDTEYTANYDTLLRKRSESEETLLELLQIQKNGGITAPVSGSVYSVADLDSDTAITDLATLSPDAEMSITISVDESDILSLQLEQEASVTVSSVSDDVLTGIVTEVDKTASDGAYTAVITLEKQEGMLPGMTANVDIKIQGSENALLVPADAVHYTSTGAFVYTGYDEELKEYTGRTDVVIGLSNDDYVEILSGLTVGDTVYYTKSTSMFDIFQSMGGMGMGNMGGGSGKPGSNFGGSGMPGGSGSQMPAMPQGGAMPGNRG